MNARLTNKVETEFVGKIGVEAGGPSDIAETPFGSLASALAQGKEELKRGTTEDDIKWTDEAKERINRVPFFVRGMAKKTVVNYAVDNGITLIDGKVMDIVRDKVGM